jgi:hypothetical protein
MINLYIYILHIVCVSSLKMCVHVKNIYNLYYNVYSYIMCEHYFKMLNVDILITVSRCIYKFVVFDFLTY